MKTYTVTQEQMDRLHGAAHSGAMLGGDAAYQGCLKVEAILAEVAFKEGFDKSPGSAPEEHAVCSLCLNRGAVPEEEPPRKNTRWHRCSCHRPILDYGWGPLIIAP